MDTVLFPTQDLNGSEIRITSYIFPASGSSRTTVFTSDTPIKMMLYTHYLRNHNSIVQTIDLIGLVPGLSGAHYTTHYTQTPIDVGTIWCTTYTIDVLNTTAFHGVIFH